MVSVLSAPRPLFFAVSLTPLIVFIAVTLRMWRFNLSRSERCITALLLLFCLAALWPNPLHALNLLNSPDASEYAMGAFRILTGGSYDIPLYEHSYPPRYPIGFSLFILLPSLLLSASHSPENSVLSVACVTALGAPSAFIIAKRTYSETAGFLAVILYLLLPGLWPSSQEIISFAPAAALWLLTLALLVVSREQSGLSASGSVAIGLSSMYAVACRPLSIFIIVPIIAFTLVRTNAPQRLLALLTPTALLIALYITYNALVFHSPFRSGYHLWCGIPYDIPALTFNATHLWSNLKPFWDSGVPLLGMLALAGYRAYATDRPALLTFWLAVIVAALVSCAHLLYFYPWSLFFLPAAAILTPFAMCTLAWFLDKAGLPLSNMVNCVLLAITAFVLRGVMYRTSYLESSYTTFISSISSHLPDDAVFISSMNPVYVSMVVAKPSIMILPIGRQVEYANKVLTPKKLPPLAHPPLSPYDHRSASIPPDFSQEVFPEVPTERPEIIQSLLSKGKAVFIDTRFISAEDAAKLRTWNTFTEIVPGLSRVSSR